ncbi:unnamed protein product [Penicillium roqueforti FM164]|uniref:Genomic scaffold, ProqFM164S02 n=1 Tax=Penicillium roqueforti (strain FM164) TaxID=1365484 RepID=W6QJW3_PENRF|nr:unnamed protein product [Penicillium roqueforti FM164]
MHWARLKRIFKIAKQFDMVLLLDAFIERPIASHGSYNRLVTAFFCETLNTMKVSRPILDRQAAARISSISLITGRRHSVDVTSRRSGAPHDNKSYRTP